MAMSKGAAAIQGSAWSIGTFKTLPRIDLTSSTKTTSLEKIKSLSINIFEITN